MRLFQKQRESLFAATKRLNIWTGPVRSGKSILSIVAFLKFIAEDAPTTGDLFCIGKTVGALRRNIISPMIDMVGPDCQYRSGEQLIKLWGRIIHVLGANDSQAETKLRGSTSAGTYGDELVLWPEEFFSMMTSRLSLKGSRFFGTTNPDSPNHWLKKNYLDRADEINLVSFHWPLRENTFLDDEYLNQIEAEYTGLWKRRFIDGEWSIALGAIYDLFDETLHTRAIEPSVPDEYIVGVDYGTTNPCVFVLMGVSRKSGGEPMIWAEREYYYDSKIKLAQRTDAEYASDMTKFLAKRDHRDVPITAIYVDPSAASFKLELQRKGHYMIKNADNTVSDGLRTVSRLIHQRRYSLSATNCPHTVEEYPNYVWDTKKSDLGVEEPVKVGDHGKDAERYALHSHFGKDSVLYTPESLAW